MISFLCNSLSFLLFKNHTILLKKGSNKTYLLICKTDYDAAFVLNIFGRLKPSFIFTDLAVHKSTRDRHFCGSNSVNVHIYLWGSPSCHGRLVRHKAILVSHWWGSNSLQVQISLRGYHFQPAGLVSMKSLVFICRLIKPNIVHGQAYAQPGK